MLDERFVMETEEAIFSLWQTCASMQTESALRFNHLVTGGELRTPNADEVRWFLDHALHGAFIPIPPSKRSTRIKEAIVDCMRSGYEQLRDAIVFLRTPM